MLFRDWVKWNTFAGKDQHIWAARKCSSGEGNCFSKMISVLMLWTPMVKIETLKVAESGTTPITQVGLSMTKKLKKCEPETFCSHSCENLSVKYSYCLYKFLIKFSAEVS